MKHKGLITEASYERQMTRKIQGFFLVSDNGTRREINQNSISQMKSKSRDQIEYSDVLSQASVIDELIDNALKM